MFERDQFIEYGKMALNQLQSGSLVLNKKANEDYEPKFINKWLAEELGYTVEELYTLMEDDIYNIIYPADKPEMADALRNMNYTRSSRSYRLKKKDGDFVWMLGQHMILPIAGIDYITILYTNVNELIGTKDKYQNSSDKWFDIVNSVPLGLAIFNINNGTTNTIAVNDTLVEFSNYVGKMLDGNSRGWTYAELSLLFNQNIYAFCAKEDEHLVKEMLDNSIDNTLSYCNFRLRGSTEEKPVYVYSSCFSREIPDGSRNYYVTFQDVTRNILQENALKKSERELYKLSFYDPLTGVKNRNAYNKLINEAIDNRVHNVGVVFADINGLKKTNDFLGHVYGDAMITKFTTLLEKYFPYDNIYRISGDEFVVFEKDIEKVAFQQIMRNVIKDVSDNDNIASVGYIWKDSVSDVKRRVSQAEQIMYVEKQHYYETSDDAISLHRPVLMNSLLNDLANGRYVMYLQPKADIHTKKIIGAEALIRKIDVKGRVISPFEFIPQFERERLISEIDYFMLEETCKFLQEMKELGHEDFKVSLNMSRVTLVENEYFEMVQSIFNRYDFNRSQLEFEVTESNETMDRIRLEDYLKIIKSLGIGISLDDVGTDYSSLPLLILDGIDTVKIDRSLVILYKNPKAKILLSSVINMCHEMGLSVIAEGIEDEEARIALDEMHCDQLQGYYLSKPIPKAEFMSKFVD